MNVFMNALIASIATAATISLGVSPIVAVICVMVIFLPGAIRDVV